MSDPLVGEIRMFAGDFAPREWAFCDGQLLSIARYSALFSIMGTTYGGDGRTTFALPDLRGRVPVHAGRGPGLTARGRGESGGQECVALSIDEMPVHTHEGMASLELADSAGAEGRVLARGEHEQYGSRPDVRLHEEAIQPAGGPASHENMPPYLCVSFIIALDGLYPQRS